MKQPLARTFGGEAFWLRRVETALIPMHSPPKPVLLLFLPFFFSFSCYWVHSCSPLTLSILYSLLSALHPICCCAGLTLSSPAQPVPPTLPKTRYPHGGTAGCFPHLFLGPLSTVSLRKKQQQCFSLFLYLCQSFSSSILSACHEQRHVFSSVRCGAQCLRFPLWWWP